MGEARRTERAGWKPPAGHGKCPMIQMKLESSLRPGKGAYSMWRKAWREALQQSIQGGQDGPREQCGKQV